MNFQASAKTQGTNALFRVRNSREGGDNAKTVCAVELSVVGGKLRIVFDARKNFNAYAAASVDIADARILRDALTDFIDG